MQKAHGSTSVAERAAALAIALAFAATPARAAEPDATAEELFQQGRRAMDAGDLAKGCRLLEQSLAAEDAAGTLLNLALCHEKLGRLVPAAAEFRRVEERALGASPPDTGRATFARQHLEAIRPKVAWLAFAWAPGVAEPAGVDVRVDGRELARADWESGAPLEPGDHAVRVTSPGGLLLATTVSIAPAPGRTLLFLGGLGAAATHAATDAEATRRTIGWASLAAGGSLVLTSAVLGVLAATSARDTTCAAPCFTTIAGADGAPIRNPDLVAAESAYDRASVLATLATGTAVVGLAGLAVGSWFLFGKPASTKTAGATVTVGLGAVIGSF